MIVGQDFTLVADGKGLIGSILLTLDKAVADVAGANLVLPFGVAEEEVGFYFFQRAPLGRGEVADLEEDKDCKLVLKGDRVQGAGAVLGI